MFAADLLKYKNHGNGVFIRWKSFFLFVLGKEEYWKQIDTHWEITYTNTGGHVESNENMLDATRREVLEEVGCELVIISANQTVLCDLENPALSHFTLEDKICPLLIYNSSELQMSVCVYLGVINSTPVPMMEVPALILLPLNLLQGGELSLLLDEGGIITVQNGRKIPKNSILKPFGSIAILVNHWEEFLAIKSFSSFLES